MIVSKYELVPSLYVIGGYSTQPYQATSKFPMEDLMNSETKEIIQPILRYSYSNRPMIDIICNIQYEAYHMVHIF